MSFKNRYNKQVIKYIDLALIWNQPIKQFKIQLLFPLLSWLKFGKICSLFQKIKATTLVAEIYDYTFKTWDRYKSLCLCHSTFPMTKPTQLFNEFETDHFEIKVGTKKIHIDTKNNLIRHGHQMSPVARIVNYIHRQRE